MKKWAVKFSTDEYGRTKEKTKSSNLGRYHNQRRTNRGAKENTLAS